MLSDVLVEVLCFNHRIEIERCRSTCKDWLGVIDKAAQTLPRHTIEKATFQTGVDSTRIVCRYANSVLSNNAVLDDDAAGDRLLAVASRLNNSFVNFLGITGQRSTTFALILELLRTLQNISICQLHLSIDRTTSSDIVSLIRECKACNLQKITLRITPQLVQELEVSEFYDLDVVRSVAEMAINLTADASKTPATPVFSTIVRRLFALPNCAIFRIFSRYRLPDFIQQTVRLIIQEFENATDLSGMVPQIVIGESYDEIAFPVAEARRAYRVPVTSGEAMEADIYYFRNKAEELTVFFAKCEFDRRQFLLHRGRIPPNEAEKCIELI